MIACRADLCVVRDGGSTRRVDAWARQRCEAGDRDDGGLTEWLCHGLLGLAASPDAKTDVALHIWRELLSSAPDGAARALILYAAPLVMLFRVIHHSSSLTLAMLICVRQVLAVALGACFFGEMLNCRAMIGLVVALLGIMEYARVRCNAHDTSKEALPITWESTALHSDSSSDEAQR